MFFVNKVHPDQFWEFSTSKMTPHSIPEHQLKLLNAIGFRKYCKPDSFGQIVAFGWLIYDKWNHIHLALGLGCALRNSFYVLESDRLIASTLDIMVWYRAINSISKAIFYCFRDDKTVIAGSSPLLFSIFLKNESSLWLSVKGISFNPMKWIPEVDAKAENRRPDIHRSILP
jgi:hypothetical protein